MKYLCFDYQLNKKKQMHRTALDKSIREFSFEIHYLDYQVDIEEIDAPNYVDILYVRCYPKWDMREKELMKLIEENKLFLFAKMQDVVEQNDLFYCYFDIDFTKIIGTTTNIVDNKARWIEARPDISKKSIDDYSNGFIDPSDLPSEN